MKIKPVSVLTDAGFFFLFSAAEQTISQYYKDQKQDDPQYQIGEKHHYKHAYGNPEQRKTAYFFHTSAPGYPIDLFYAQYSAPIPLCFTFLQFWPDGL